MSTSGTPGAHLNEHEGCQVRVTLNRKCVSFIRREKRVSCGTLLMKWLYVIYSPLLKGWMSACKSVCVCGTVYVSCVHECVFF